MTNEPFLKQLEFHVRSANSGLWVISHETEEVLRTTLQLKLPCQGDDDLPIVVINWDAADGGRDLSCIPHKQVLPSDPIKALNTFRIRAQEKKENEVQILVLQNFHLALEHPVVKQTFINAIQEGKANGLIYLVVSPKTEMPLELQHLVTQLDFKPPTKDEIRSIALGLNEGETEDLLNQDAVIDAVIGLTRREIEQALALGCIRDSFRSPSDPNRLRLLTEDLWDSKEQILKQKPFLKLLRSQRGFDQLGGLKGIKRFLTKLLQPDDLPPKGVLLIGPPGTGKSVLAKSLGYETQRAVVQLDLGACYNKHVGESEANIRDALNSIEAMGKVILFIDEVEKALSGSGGEGDSGVGARVLGTLLTWLSDRAESGSEVFFIATSNDISKLPPEFSRAGRFDRIFFLDLPGEEEREEIWKKYTALHSIPWEQYLAVKDANWTGAEIEQACYLARKLKVSLHEIASEIVPVAETYSEQINRLRTESNNRYICARTGKRYQFDAAVGTPMSLASSNAPRRKLLGGGNKEEM